MKKILVILLFFYSMAAAENTATIIIAWDAPTTNADGSALTDLAGYKIYYDTDQAGDPYNGTGFAAGDSPINIPLDSLTDISNPEYILSLIPTGTYFLVVTAYDDVNNESDYSNEVTASAIDTQAPAVPVVGGITITIP